MKPQNFILALAFVTTLIIFSACKKADVNAAAPSTPTVNPVTPTSMNQVLDSSLLLSREIYLWYNQIPSTFNAASYADPTKLMEAIRQYSVESGFSAPVDKWSFAMKKKDWDNESNGLVMSNTTANITGDFGISVFFRAEGDLRVRSVEKASPAGEAGIHRSWRVLKINGNTNLTTTNSTFILDNVYNSSNTSFTFGKPDGSTADITLNAATYKTQPVYLDTIYNLSTKRIGYLVFNSFLGDTTQMYNNFQRVFSKFASQDITDIAIDLRYNGGGYVSVQDKLADMLVSSSANNSLMFKEQFNDKNSQYNAATNFQKTGSLNLSRIYFIVSNSTASASELLINNLKPYMDVQLVGPSNTYGKPVGFFPIGVGDWYIFPVSFRSINKNGTGNYFNGLPVNNRVADGLDKDWGDVTESCLASVLKRVTTSSYRPGGNSEFTEVPAAVKNSNAVLDAPFFKGAIGNALRP